jgi:hypothetical protein
MRESMAHLTPQFSANRTVREYTEAFHDATGFTFSLKNFIGVNWSMKGVHQTPLGLHQGIADLATLIKPKLIIMDALKTLVTKNEAIDMARDFCKAIGKETVLCQDTPGFIANRLSMVYLVYVIRCYEQGLATREDIFADYTRKTFEREFERFFAVLDCVPVSGSDRLVYRMTERGQ